MRDSLIWPPMKEVGSPTTSPRYLYWTDVGRRASGHSNWQHAVQGTFDNSQAKELEKCTVYIGFDAVLLLYLRPILNHRLSVYAAKAEFKSLATNSRLRKNDARSASVYWCWQPSAAMPRYFGSAIRSSAGSALASRAYGLQSRQAV